MKKLFIAVVASVILMGCASAPNISPVYVKSQVIHTPPINIESEAEIGQTISSKANLAIYPAISISQDISERIQVSLSSNAWSGVTTIHSGIFSKTFESPEGSFFVDPQGIFVYLMGTVPCLCGVFVPNNAANSPVIFSDQAYKGEFHFGVTPVSLTKTTYEVWGADSLKKELIYGGLSQKTISLSYREFSDQTARPAFTQDLKYDLTDGDVIGFRGARFQVIKATNISIKYKVLKPLD